MIWLDHAAICAETLDEGTAWVEDRLGVTLSPGGKHLDMGTHNRLLGLGPEQYLEVITIDPDGTRPDRPRWFDLDRFSGPPRPASWICATAALDDAVARAPDGVGSPLDLSRGDLEWRFTIAPSGQSPFDGLFPPLIQWRKGRHPATRLPDHGIRLKTLTLTHPRADALNNSLQSLGLTTAVNITKAPNPAITLAFQTPAGPKVLA